MQKDNIIIYKDTKQAYLKVKPNKEVSLTVPLDMTDKEIKYILKKKTT
jgi:predicted metal-dependent hydrolase